MGGKWGLEEGSDPKAEGPKLGEVTKVWPVPDPPCGGWARRRDRICSPPAPCPSLLYLSSPTLGQFPLLSSPVPGDAFLGVGVAALCKVGHSQAMLGAHLGWRLRLAGSHGVGRVGVGEALTVLAGNLPDSSSGPQG